MSRNREPVKLEGGPYDGHRWRVGFGGTLLFRLGEWRGRYDNQGRWEIIYEKVCANCGTRVE